MVKNTITQSDKDAVLTIVASAGKAISAQHDATIRLKKIAIKTTTLQLKVEDLRECYRTIKNTDDIEICIEALRAAIRSLQNFNIQFNELQSAKNILIKSVK